MKIVTNDVVINRNGKIGFWASLISPVVLAISASIFFTAPQQIGLSLGLFVIGFVMYQTGVVMRRWGRGTDLALNSALKKLGDDYTLYHFHTPVAHLLTGPAGIWILVPRYVRGVVTYNEQRRRWRLQRPGLLAKTFAPLTDSLGKPGADLLGEADALDRYLQKHWKEEEQPYVSGAIVFMHEQAEVQAGNAPIPTLHVTELRKFLREQEQENKMPKKLVTALNRIFEGEGK